MVAFNFHPRFAEAIRSGAKRQTIRARPRVAPGQRVQLYTGLRTRFCRKLRPDQQCTVVLPVGLDVLRHGFGEMIVDGLRLFGPDRERLATDDGFASLEEMHGFWVERHGLGRFEGALIRWAAPIEIMAEEAA